MSKKRLEAHDISVDTFEVEGIPRFRGTIRANENIVEPFAGVTAAPTVIEVCTKNPNYTCDGSQTCSGIETCDGDASCPLGCAETQAQFGVGA